MSANESNEAPTFRRVLLSTADNPYDPFTQYSEWRAYDVASGYYTDEYLARLAYTSPNLSEADYFTEVERAIDDILKYNPTNNYIKVIEGEFKFKGDSTKLEKIL